MIARPTLKLAAVFAVLLTFLVGAAAVQSQQRRRRPSRRASSPVSPTYTPAPSPAQSADPRFVSTTEEAAQEDSGAARRERRNRQAQGEQPQQPDASRRAVEQLSSEITQLNKRMSEMERQRRADLLQERLTRAEQRVEALQTQLSDVLEKQANMQARVEQLDEAMRTENLDRQVATVGTFRPDEAREALRRQLDNEKRRVQAQLEVQNVRRQQLEKSLNDATQLADRVRSELDEAMRREAEGDTGGTPAVRAPRPSPRTAETPAPTPTPPQQ